GADILTGGDGADTFSYRLTSDFGDEITDYESGADILNFSSNLGWGDEPTLASRLFNGIGNVTGNTACLYTEGGDLYYDSDGTDANGAVVVAQGVTAIDAAHVTLTLV
ncbi:MAG: hypothetical protein Q8O35_12515, partial [Humidesulfovibrio sp.]|uniref:hypothetical protein n=1 Tax=Humidesulfovibrio sp. TaxID=2910988 RepID=UPI0027376792